MIKLGEARSEQTHNCDIYALSKKIVCAVLCASKKQFI